MNTLTKAAVFALTFALPVTQINADEMYMTDIPDSYNDINAQPPYDQYDDVMNYNLEPEMTNREGKVDQDIRVYLNITITGDNPNCENGLGKVTIGPAEVEGLDSFCPTEGTAYMGPHRDGEEVEYRVKFNNDGGDSQSEFSSSDNGESIKFTVDGNPDEHHEDIRL